MKTNQVAGRAAVGLSLVALAAVFSGYFGPMQPDEGAAAHIFQLSIVLFVPTVLVFLATMAGNRPRRNVLPLLFSSGVLAIAFGSLYYLEHFR